MNAMMMWCSGFGTAALTAAGALLGPPEGGNESQFPPVAETFFLAWQKDSVDPPRGRWEANLAPVGSLTIVVDERGRHVTINGQPLSPDRVVWQPDNFVMIFDEARRRQFQVKLGEGARIEAVRPGSWLEYRVTEGPRVAIGVYTDPISPALAAQLGLELDSALMVSSVIEHMPAFKSGVQPYDVITAIDAEERVTRDTLERIVRQKRAGETVHLRLVRRAKPLEIEVAVQEVKSFPATQDLQIAGFRSADEPALIFEEPFKGDSPLGWIGGEPGQVFINIDDNRAIMFPTERYNAFRAGTGVRSLMTTGREPDLSRLEEQIAGMTQRLAELEERIDALLAELAKRRDSQP